MRLIDKDKVINVIDTYDNTDYSLEEVTSITGGIHTEIEKIETIDAVPVAHGHWESINADDSGYAAIYRCSVCKRGISIGYYDAYCDYEYCPRCGAKMNEEGYEQE